MPFDFDANPLTMSGLWPNTLAPVQVDIYGYCQMACFYCFANLNKAAAGRELNGKNGTQSLLNRLDRHLADEESPIGHWMREGYYIGFSNTTDPFQREESNHRSSEAFLLWAMSNRQPVFLETKGNVLLHEWDRYSKLLDPSRTVAYVTLSMLDDKLRRRLEPGAIGVDERLELIRRLSAMGMPVIAACNPYVPDWVPDIGEYCARVKAAGAHAVFPSFLHFSPKQAAQIPKAYQGEVDKANVRAVYQEKFLRKWIAAATDHGLIADLEPVFYRHLGYHGNSLFDYDRIRENASPFYWFIDFTKILKATSDANGNASIIFSWIQIEQFLRHCGVANPVLNTAAMDTVLNHTSEGHKSWAAGVGKRANLYSILQWMWNNPKRHQGVVWDDPHTRALYDTAGESYYCDDDGNIMGIWLPGSNINRNKLMIDMKDIDLDSALLLEMGEVGHV